MSRFYVGCRVRILRSLGWPELAGQEGRISGTPPTKGVEGLTEWIVAPDVWGTDAAPYQGLNGAARFGPNSDQLEPITDPGRELVAWAECLWSPESITA